jgi:hypothetical protein
VAASSDTIDMVPTILAIPTFIRRFWRACPPAALVHATGVLVIAMTSAGCDKMQLTAPTESTITLFASANTVPLNGSVDILGTVTESSGTPVQNGTVVTFTTTLGRIDPAEARTNNGKVTVRLTADGRSGTATITAFSGGIVSEAIELPVGAAAAESIVLTAQPASVGSGGGTVTLTAAVRDEDGNLLPGVAVSFSATAGQLGSTTVTTDANGQARTTLTTNQESEVTATAAGAEATFTVTVTPVPSVSVTVLPASPVVDAPAVFTITVTNPEGAVPIQSISIDYGDGSQVTLPATGSTSASHVYTSTGTFKVTVRVSDSNGQRTTQTLTLVVKQA